MPAKVVPSNGQVIQQNLNRLKNIFSLPPEYFVKIVDHHDPLFQGQDYLWLTDYEVTIGINPRQVSVPIPDNRLFSKPRFKNVTRYTRVARIIINPFHSPERSSIHLFGNNFENEFLCKMIDDVSTNWIFEKGQKKNINLDINVFPESENEYFDVE